MNEISTLNDAMVICTRNRVSDLDVCLKSLETQSRKPFMTLVVDSSDGSDSAELVASYNLLGNLPNLTYVHTDIGLTKQRNIGLVMLEGKIDVVHFVDDDVEMEFDYVSELIGVFNREPLLAGCGGMVLGSIRNKPSRVAVLGFRDSETPGVVLSSGFNVGAYETPEEVSMAWLPGCSMSFRMSTIEGLRFDERRTGYAIGEDVDFGMKVSARGELRHIPTARLLHHQSPTNRHRRPELVRMAVRHRWSLAHDHSDRVKKHMVVIATLTQSAHFMSRAVIKLEPLLFKCSVASIQGLTDAFAGGKRSA